MIRKNGVNNQGDREALFGGQPDPWQEHSNADGDELQAQREREIACLQQQIFANTAQTIDIGADTLETLVRQREQTQRDLRRIETIHGKLTAAELLIQKMERGMFNMGGSKTKIKPPPSKTTDSDFPIQVKHRVRYSNYILRFTQTFCLRLSASGDEVYDTMNYGHIKSISVSKTPKYFTVSFNMTGVKPWLVYSHRYQDVVKEMVKCITAQGFEVVLDFEAGEADFTVIDEVQEGHRLAAEYRGEGSAYGNSRMLEACTRKGSKVDMDDMYDVVSEGLKQIQELGVKQGEVLEAHTADLNEMQPQVANLHGDITRAQGRIQKIRK